MRIRSPLWGIARLASDSLYRNSIFMAATSLFNAGCGFFFWMIAARLYTVEQVGLATALISSLGLIILFSRLGFDTSIIRFYPSEDRGSVIGTSLAVTTAACLLAGLGYALVPHLAWTPAEAAKVVALPMKNPLLHDSRSHVVSCQGRILPPAAAKLLSHIVKDMKATTILNS